jgi:conjugal transfer mating pair stabilization protein TraN
MVIRYFLPFLALLTTASAQNMCFVDQNDDGFFDQIEETADCSGPLCPLTKTACDADITITDPPFICPDPGEDANFCTPTGGVCTYFSSVCPIDEPLCVPDDGVDTIRSCIPDGLPIETVDYSCPLTGGGACVDDGSGDFFCSTPCEDVGGAGGFVDQSRPREYTQDDGARDTNGACLDEIRLFEGFAMDCRPVGLQTVFKNCCQDRGKIIQDSQGSSSQQPGMSFAGPALFGGLGAATTNFLATGSSSSAATAGTNAMVIGFDPTTIALGAAFVLMVDMLDLGCDAQDMETGVLRGSGMCHYVGDYCSLNSPFGCVQKKRGHCCFNSKLARIIHQQGRSQIASFSGLPNGGWGEAEAPMCRGFTPQEFQSLDFGQMDLSEYYTELQTRAASEMQVIMQTTVDEYADENGI